MYVHAFMSTLLSNFQSHMYVIESLRVPLPQTSDDASPGGPGQRRQRGDGAASSAASGPRKPLSLAAQSVQKELGATYGRAITISTVGVRTRCLMTALRDLKSIHG